MKIKSLIIFVVMHQLQFITANQNFYRVKLLENNLNNELNKKLERNLYGKNATREISIGDISNKINEIIKDRNLKLISQSNSNQTNHYLLETPKGKEMNLNIKQNLKGFKLNLNQRDLSLDRSLQIGIQDYNLNQVDHFLHTQLQQIKNAERKLAGEEPDKYTFGEWKEIIELKLPSDKNLQLKAKDDKEVEGELTPENPYEFEVYSKEDHELFAIKISIETVKKRQRKILKLYNNEKDHFKDNHSKFERRIVEADRKNDLEEYLETTIEQLLQSIDQSQLVSMDKIIQHIKEKKLKDITFENEEENVYNIKYGEKYAGYMNIYKIGQKYYGVSIKLEDRSFSTKLPVSAHNFDIAMEQFLNELESFLSGEQNGGKPLLTIEFTTAVDNILDELGNQCKQIKEIKHDSSENKVFSNETLKRHVAKFEFKDFDECLFTDSNVLIQQISTGYFQYIHLVFENNIMKTEYMIGLSDETFKERATNVVNEITEKIETIKKSQDDADDDVDLKFNTVKDEIDKIAKENNINCNKKDNEFFTCTYKDTNSLFAIVKETDNQILVNLMDNTRDDDEIKTTASNPSFSFQKRNGYDQMEGFKKDLEKFITEQSKRKLRKVL